MANHNPFLMVVFGDFNVKSENWYRNDKTSCEGAKLDVSAVKFGLLTSRQNLIMESGVHSSFYLNCHHQITYVKLNLKIHYPSPYEREIWHYDQANVDQIRKAADLFPWEKALRNFTINYMAFLKKATENIISNCIPR